MQSINLRGHGIYAHNSLLQMEMYVREYELRKKSNNNSGNKEDATVNWRTKNWNEIHTFENDRFLFLYILNETLNWEGLNVFSSFLRYVFVSHIHLLSSLFENCSRLDMSCDFMRYLFCGLVLGDKRWQDFICILVCVSSSSPYGWLYVVMKVGLKNVTRRQCKVSSVRKKSSF